MIKQINEHVPSLEPDAWIAGEAIVIGDVVLEKNSSVWFGAVVRGDIEKITIGENSNIQDRCVLHTDEGSPLTIGKNVVVGHSVNLHGCTIGDGALIGIGATVLNGATIGKGAIVGAGALVAEGVNIPDGKLAVGLPAKIVPSVKQDEKLRISQGVKHYMELKDMYMEQDFRDI